MSRRESARGSITIGAFAAFFMFGFVDNIKGPVIPTILEDYCNSLIRKGPPYCFSAYLGLLDRNLIDRLSIGNPGREGILVFAGVIMALELSAMGP